MKLQINIASAHLILTTVDGAVAYEHSVSDYSTTIDLVACIAGATHLKDLFVANLARPEPTAAFGIDLASIFDDLQRARAATETDDIAEPQPAGELSGQPWPNYGEQADWMEGRKVTALRAMHTRRPDMPFSNIKALFETLSAA